MFNEIFRWINSVLEESHSMACFKLLQGWRKTSGRVVFTKPHLEFSMPFQVPCGQCIGCRLEHSRQWAVRMVHHSNYFDSNSFITLTFSDEFLPYNSSLDFKLFQDFFKRFRIDLQRNGFLGSVQYFHCGEYGELKDRPHYHAVIFGYDFPDKYRWKENNGYVLYRSSFLESLWPFGHSSVGQLTFLSAGYVARYCCKKITGEKADSRYRIVDVNGEIIGYRKPEYCTMSLKPAIGKPWIDEYLLDTYKDDTVVMNGFESRPPRYYDKQLKLVYPSLFDDVKRMRIANAKRFTKDLTPQMNYAAEQIKLAEFGKLVRNLY